MLKVSDYYKDQSDDCALNLKVECENTLLNAKYLCEFLRLKGSQLVKIVAVKAESFDQAEPNNCNVNSISYMRSVRHTHILRFGYLVHKSSAVPHCWNINVVSYEHVDVTPIAGDVLTDIIYVDATDILFPKYHKTGKMTKMSPYVFHNDGLIHEMDYNSVLDLVH